MSRMVLAYHVTFCTHGFWLPNDPRGSGSFLVRQPALYAFGPAPKVATRYSVAHDSHDADLRRAAKQNLVYPEVVLSGEQALRVAQGFAWATRQSGYCLWACAILPQHVHLVIAPHRYSIEQVVRRLRQAATFRLMRDGPHPFARQRLPSGRLPSIWGEDFWKVFLWTSHDVTRAVEYVEQNPVKEGKPLQKWSFVTKWDAG